MSRPPSLDAREASIGFQRGARGDAGHVHNGSTVVLHKASTASTLIDVLDRVLDKGIVFDAWTRVSVAGIDLITVEAQVIVASIDTYLSPREANRILFIVAADQPALLEILRGRTAVTWTNVVLDRRRRERRRRTKSVAKSRRQGERRLRDVDRELKSAGMAAVLP